MQKFVPSVFSTLCFNIWDKKISPFSMYRAISFCFNSSRVSSLKIEMSLTSFNVLLTVSVFCDGFSDSSVVLFELCSCSLFSSEVVIFLREIEGSSILGGSAIL